MPLLTLITKYRPSKANPEPRKKSTKASCKSVDKVKQFVFEGDDELREGYLKVKITSHN